MKYSQYIYIYINNSIRTSQETHYLSFTNHNRRMLFGETAAVCCESHMEHTDTDRTSGNTLHLRYRAQPVNAVWGNSC
jgi:hypothetical protein